MSKIIGLQAENVKRLKAVDLQFDATMQVIGGNNAQGKTSVLDAIWLTLGGGAAKKDTVRPVRDGAETATATVTLDDYVVTRTWKADGKTTLTVTTPDGAKIQSPQTILDALVPKIGIDPIAFTRLAPREQLQTLLSLVDLPFDPKALDTEYKTIFEQRTVIGREVDRIKAHGMSLPVVPEDTPDEEVSATALVEQRDKRLAAARAVESSDIAAAALVEAKAQAARLVENAEQAVARALEQAVAAREAVAGLPKIDSLTAQIQNVDTVNAAVRAKREKAITTDQWRVAHKQYNDLTTQLEAIKQRKADGLAAAKFPVEGLGFDTEGVTYNGVPFSQASSAEQNRVSVAMGMAMTPTLRTLFIRDGSLLDSQSMSMIHEMAAAADYQIIIERVGDGDAGAIIIEDGAAK